MPGHSLTIKAIKFHTILGGSSGRVVMGCDSTYIGCGFESQHRILDGNFSL